MSKKRQTKKSKGQNVPCSPYITGGQLKDRVRELNRSRDIERINFKDLPISFLLIMTGLIGVIIGISIALAIIIVNTP